MKRKKFLLVLILLTTTLFAQRSKSSKMLQTTLEELQMQVYDKDSTAAAVVLYEHANTYLDPDNDTRTDYYFRIKILDKAAFDVADISIPLYKETRVKDIEAITYNLVDGQILTTELLKKDIFTTKENENWEVKKFTLPKIQEGSVLEYKYSIISPYSGFEDWKFQSDIPKIKSELDIAILGNYKYNIRLVGFLKLDKNDISIKKKCVHIDGLGDGSCLVYAFGMNNIPAFKEEEHMLSKKNYLSKISFDLESFTSPRGVVKNYTTTWKDADKEIKSNFFNNQISKISYFKKQIPESIFAIENKLEKAKKIYSFIQNHYTWNKKYWTNRDAKVKDAFKNAKGDVGEINLSLYNSLKAADLDAELVVLSTRNNGIPTKIFPVIYDYNYVILKTSIEGIDYFLDATDKFLPFGQVPVRTLNGEARIINFDKSGTWTTLAPKENTSKDVKAKLTLNEDGEFEGNLMIYRKGYFASSKRKELDLLSEESYLEEFESENPDLEVIDYKVNNENNIEKTLQEIFKVAISMNESLENTVRINPFFFERIKNNPFKLKERLFPVDFAYPYKSNYSLNLEIPDSYQITKIPKNKAIALPNNGGSFILRSTNNKNSVSILVRFNINKKIFSSEEYFTLKEFFKQIIISENSYITIQKKQ